MTLSEDIYSAPLDVDVASAIGVFAFLLVQDRVFFHPGDDLGQMRAVCEALHAAKRDALLKWYAHAHGDGQ